MTSYMVTAATNNAKEKSTVIVLGCKVYGERPSLMLVERLEAAYDYLVENPNSVCILSGGQGTDEDISEAECMYRYLISQGISSERLYKEEKSTSTRENLIYSKDILDSYQLNKDIAIVTNEFHEYRAGKIAESLGLEYSAVSAKTAWWLLPTYYVRELYGILYEWVY
ncbi:YdcF family protein [Anaerosporobacter sp.]